MNFSRTDGLRGDIDSDFGTRRPETFIGEVWLIMLDNSPEIHRQSDLLGIPGYFYCDKTRCTLRAEICVKRQKVNENTRHKNDTVPFLICLDCDQGKRMKKRWKHNMEDQTVEINQASPILTFYPDKFDNVEIKCPKCLLKTVIDATEYQYSNNILKVRCKCGVTFKCKIDFKKFYRHKVNFAGEYEILKNRKLGDMLVENLSLDGIGFVNMAPHNLVNGDILMVKFRLDDSSCTEIRRNVKIISIQKNYINTEFIEANRFDSALGFYLKRQSPFIVA